MKEEIVTLTEENLHKYRTFCGLSGRYLEGNSKKTERLKDRLREGLRYKIYQVNGHKAGFIEYIPGEYAWRGVNAKGYLFIHCLWVIGKNKGHGYGRKLLEACLEDAKDYHGVAVVVSKTHWLPTPKIFLKNGFEVVDHAPPSFDLLVRRNSANAPLPRFKKNWYRAKKYPNGLTFLKSAQCPYMYVMDEGIRQIGRDLNIPINIVQLKTAREAQNLPCAYGVMALYYNGELLTYHPTNRKQIVELLEAKMVSSMR
ncbi:MAG TPA: GNAT family N-acetyltransferase [Anaerolineales bacterium]|nr:GNAT family N-acetyltransferase [Anaerolineales bacterium]